MKKFLPADVKFIRARLLAWFKENQRDLPWRRTYDPYHVWISEIMLQQTQVGTALPYYDRWMKALPTIELVARADEDTILKLWEGLGYYSRARNIQRAAQKIVSEFGGKFPSRYEDILKLPGVGRYTAGAIGSIAFNQDRPSVDGNVVRVIARLLNFSGNVRLPKNIELFWKRAGELLPRGKSRDFNQSLMELGALICTPKQPKCGQCVLRNKCRFFSRLRRDQNDRIALCVPNFGVRSKVTPIRVAIAVIKKGDRVFIQKRPLKGLMPGLWEFPGGKVGRGEKVQEALAREIAEEVGVTIKNIRPIVRIQHGYTRFKVDLHCFSADYDGGRVRLRAASAGKWVMPKKLRDYPFPAANIRLIEQLV